ncbi:MAG: hypothetical protein CME17_04030 [Gemmatimonadetes bacterium]|nr:hypothetical protein [Gemmatimonadota bacterium]|tara:strand:+ start:484 stop:801 length:318 start_codon:yes stop_codon:yes gene_type:complete
MAITEHWERKASRRRVAYRHRAHRIIERARKKDLMILMQQVPPIPPGTKVVIYEMPDPSWLSITIAAIEDSCANKWRRYDPYEVVILGGVGLLGLLLGMTLAYLS